MKNLLKFFKGKTLQAILAPLFKMTEVIFELFVPIIVANIIDIGIANHDSRYIITRSVLLIALGIIGFLFTLFAQYFSANCAAHFAYGAKKAMLKKANELSFLDVDKIGTNKIVTLLTNDVDRVQNGVNMTLRLLLRSPFVVFGAAIASFTIDLIGASVFAVMLPILIVVVFLILLYGVRLYNKSQKQIDTLTVLTRESTSGVRVIRAFAKEDESVQEFKEANEVYTKMQLRAGRVSALMNPLSYAIVNLGIIAVLYFTGARVHSGTLTQGGVIALYNYMSQILIELIKFANLTVTISRAGACAKRISQFLDIKPSQEFIEKDVEQVDTDECIKFNNVAISYQGGANAIEGISFTVKKGETLGIIGGTGSGKSTLCSLIPRYYDATAGDIYLDGKNVKDYTKDDLRKKIAYVFQTPSLFKDTIEKNITMYKDATSDEIEKAVKTSQSTDIIKAKENGLQEEVTRDGTNLSGGQKQRISIARAICANPEILILDDSASALDNITAAKLHKEIKDLGITTILVSQRTSNVMHADKIICLDQGKLVGIGTHKELLENCELYKEIYSSQFGGEIAWET